MSQAAAFIHQLQSLNEGERSRLRRLAGQPPDKSLAGFDLFTGVWWPLRQRNQAAPRRETSWLIAQLFGAFPIPVVTGDSGYLPSVLGANEPTVEQDQKRYRGRFDALLQAALPGLEPHLHWALHVVAATVERKRCPGLDWAQLLDDLSIWDRADEHRLKRDVRDIWAEEYLKAVKVL
ncbi:MAG: type I-E CRISPR-associated protein Cse2/CasB [Chloroflexi bacterium]|nr:type I-E CRISPR-associated protein Cse2/CasB [Chloroflexota bacterium]